MSSELMLKQDVSSYLLAGESTLAAEMCRVYLPPKGRSHITLPYVSGLQVSK